MEKLIDDVLKQYRKTNLHSEAGRQIIIRAIMKEIRNPNRGYYLNMNKIDGRIPEVTDKEEEAKWVCQHCGESTFKVEYDYIGSDYNHLECDMKEENNDYVYSGDMKDAQQQAYNEMTADGLPPGGDAQAVLESHKLAEEIAEGSVELGYIFESPDGGKTIYRRRVGESERELVSKENWKEYNRNRHGVKVNDTES